MNEEEGVSRKAFLQGSCAAGIGLLPAWPLSTLMPADLPAWFEKIKDPEIRQGVLSAIEKNLVPAAVEQVYPGHFNISADGGAYGGGATWPGLDSWQMAGAYLLMGRTRMVQDYFDFVRASQRRDGNVPFAIFTGDTRPGGFLCGLKYPDDLFTYRPPKREGLPASSRETRTWIGLFEHWQPKANPLSVLGPICYILTAAEIHDACRSAAWLHAHLPSVEAAGGFLLTRKESRGLIGGSGFYTELPPRYGCDGVTQCYAIRAMRDLARLCRADGRKQEAAKWSAHADGLAKAFTESFWRGDHFAEYVHAERGLVDSHGLSDVNWAAVAFGLVDGERLKKLWVRLTGETAFWWGGIPTLTVTRPFSYEKWEMCESVPLNIVQQNDVAAMGRAWYLEAVACKRMHAKERLLESARRVSRAAKDDGFWRERYHPKPDGSSSPAGAQKYCEYAAVLIRVVLGNPRLFT